LRYLKLNTNGAYAGAYRDSDRVVYFIPDTSNAEYVLYDFNLELGDTIIHPFGGAACSNDTVLVDHVDSILISGNYHKTILFSSMASWTEGIGSHNYLLYPYQNACLSGNDILRCMQSDNTYLWGGANNFCITSVAENEKLNKELLIYPNPSNSDFKVSIGVGVIRQIIVLDVTGRVVLNQTPINQNQFTIQKLLPGVYIVKVINWEGNVAVKRIVSK
jgi:hypothetical protein